MPKITEKEFDQAWDKYNKNKDNLVYLFGIDCQQMYKSLNQLWRCSEYERFRKLHLDSKRSELSPCKSCTVI